MEDVSYRLGFYSILLSVIIVYILALPTLYTFGIAGVLWIGYLLIQDLYYRAW